MTTWTAVCPNCGCDALWTAKQGQPGSEDPPPDVACSCAVEPAEAINLAVKFLRQGFNPSLALRCLEAA